MKGTKKIALKEEVNGSNLNVIGISSHESDYRLSWALNTSLDFNFSKTDNLDISIPKLNVINSFSTFSFFDPHTNLFFKMISNRCNNGFLSTELKNMDFFLIIDGMVELPHIQQYISTIKSIDIVHAAIYLDVATQCKKLIPIISMVAA